MFGSTQPTASTGTTGSTLGRSASFSFSQPPANKPFSGTSGGFSFGGGASASTATCQLTAAAPAPAAGGFGGFGAAKPATGGSFASSATTTTSQPAASGGLFGGASSSQPPAGGGLFGSTSSSQPQASGGLFGSSTALVQQQPQQQQQQPAAGGGLFGSSSQPPAGGATGGTGLFGSSTQGGGLFGSTNNQQQQQQPTGFGFGSSTTGLFGSSTNNAGAQGGGFGQSQNSFQAGQSQQAAASPFARFGYHQKERFNDLPEDARKPVEELDKHITSQIQTKDELKTKDFGSEIRKCAAKWHELDSALKSISATLESDSNQARDVAERVERDRSDNATLYAIATNAREGRSDASGFIEWLQKYFVGLAEEFRERMQRYWSVMETIERHLQSLDQREQFTPQAISNVIHAQHVSFMSLAAEVASLHSEVETLKKDYAKWYKQTYKSFRDPFGSMNQLSSSVPP